MVIKIIYIVGIISNFFMFVSSFFHPVSASGGWFCAWMWSMTATIFLFREM